MNKPKTATALNERVEERWEVQGAATKRKAVATASGKDRFAQLTKRKAVATASGKDRFAQLTARKAFATTFGSSGVCTTVQVLEEKLCTNMCTTVQVLD